MSITGEILAAAIVAVSPVLASEVLLATFEQAVVWQMAVIQGTPVAVLMVDHRPPRP